MNEVLLACVCALLLLLLLLPHSPALDYRSPPVCLVINLDKSVDRLTNFLRHFQRSDLRALGFSRVSGVDGQVVDIERVVSPSAARAIYASDKSGFRVQHSELTRGAVGCLLSHVKCMELFLRTNSAYGFIFEDDAVIRKDTYARTREIVSQLPAAWDLLLLGYFCKDCMPHKRKQYGSVRTFYGLHGFVASRAGARKFLRACSLPVHKQVDHLISDQCSSGRISIYCADQQLVRQANGRYVTDIQKPLKPCVLAG